MVRVALVPYRESSGLEIVVSKRLLREGEEGPYLKLQRLPVLPVCQSFPMFDSIYICVFLRVCVVYLVVRVEKDWKTGKNGNSPDQRR